MQLTAAIVMNVPKKLDWHQLLYLHAKVSVDANKVSVPDNPMNVKRTSEARHCW